MEEQYKNQKIKALKAESVKFDLIGIWLLTYLASIALYLVFGENYAAHIGFECNISYFESVNISDDLSSWNNTRETFCDSNLFIFIGGYVIAAYIFTAAFCIASPLQNTPANAVMGMVARKHIPVRYYTTEEGQRPAFHQGLRMMMVSRYLFPLYLFYLYVLARDFQTNLYDQGAIWVFAATLSGLTLYEHFSKNPLSWDERFSGLRVQVPDQSFASIEHQAKKYTGKWYYRPFTRFSLFFERTQISTIILFLFFAIMGLNFLRDIGPPADYDAVLYGRPAIDWDNNGYFALVGMNAPQDIDDFYTYGRERTHYDATRWAAYKKEIGLPFVNDTPDLEYTLYNPDNALEPIEFNNAGIEDWHCLYDLDTTVDASACPDMADVMALRDKNAVLWARFQNFTSHGINFEVPDKGIGSETYGGSAFISLTQLHAAHLVNLVKNGRKDQSMDEWLRHMALYNNMVSAHDNMVSKAIFMIILGIHFNTLETLLYNDPSIAVQYGDEITAVLHIDDISAYRAEQMLADDWRTIEPTFIPYLGRSAHIRRKNLKCFQHNQTLASLPAHEYLSIDGVRFCPDVYPEDLDYLLLRTFFEPGSLIPNIINNLLIGGVLKGGELIENMHTRVARFRMAKLAIKLIQDDVSPSEVQQYLDQAPQELWNPITQEPFLWDAEKRWLYTPNLNDPALEPNKTFRVNLPR